MLALLLLSASLLLAFTNIGSAQESETPPPDHQTTEMVKSEVAPKAAVSTAEGDTAETTTETLQENVKRAYGLAALSFMFVMFTNAILCGHWAIQTKRSFWGWYIAGMLTGPLAGGCMLHRTAIDQSGENTPGGCVGSIAGILVPIAGWFFWLVVLSQ